MKLRVRVKPNAKQISVKKTSDFILVSVKEKAEKGKANKELIRILSNYFSVPTSSVKILKGLKSRDKIVEVDMEN